MTSPGARAGERAVQGDPDATSSLLELVRPDVSATAGAISDESAASTPQRTTFCSGRVASTVLRALPGFRDPGHPVIRICVRDRRAQDRGTSQRAAGRHLTVATEDTVFDRADTNPGPEQQAVAADQARRLAGLLRHISELHARSSSSAWQSVFRRGGGAILGMSAGAVRVAQSRHYRTSVHWPPSSSTRCRHDRRRDLTAEAAS